MIRNEFSTEDPHVLVVNVQISRQGDLPHGIFAALRYTQKVLLWGWQSSCCASTCFESIPKPLV